MRAKGDGWARTVFSASDLEAALGGSYIRGLDFLRALAVALVVWGHAAEGHIGLLAASSSLGVKLFFVLSGFLITRLLLNEHDRHQRIDFVGFYRRRCARLLPVFYLYLAVVIGLLVLRGQSVPWAAVASSVLYVTNYYQAFTGAETNIVAHCWSLSVEEQFYLLWPAVLAILVGRGVSLSRALVFTILGVWSWRWAQLAWLDGSVHYLYRALETRADDLAVGCLLAVAVRDASWRGRLTRWVSVPGVGFAAFLAVLGAVVLEGRGPAMKYGFSAVVEAPLLALLLLLTVLHAGRRSGVSRWINHPWIVQVGKVSYGMYLFHGLVMFSVTKAVLRATGNELVAVLVATAVLVALASLSARWFEEPLRRRFAGRPAPKRPDPESSGALSVPGFVAPRA